MENLQNKQLEELFDIKEQKMKELDKTSIETIQDEFCFKLNYNSEAPSIMRKNGISKSTQSWRITINENLAKKNFPYFMKKIEKGADAQGIMEYITSCDDLSRNKIFIFKINKVFIKEGKYFMYTSDGQILTANKLDFDQNGLFAKSLSFFGEPLTDDIGGKTSKTVFENGLESEAKGDGFIHFYDKGKNVLDLPGDKIFKIEQSNVLISDGGMLSKYKILDSSHYKKGETFEVPYKGITQMVVDYNMNFLFIINETDEGSTLHIISYDDFLNKNKIIEYFSIRNVKTICGLGRENGMLCEMNDGSIQYFRNTFSKFKRNFFKDNEDGTPGGKLIYRKDEEVKKVSDSGKLDLLESLGNGTISFDFDEDVVDESEQIDNDIIEKIWDIKIPDKEETLEELFNKANDEESIELVSELFKKIKRHPTISKHIGIIRAIEQEITDKKYEIILESIFTDLGNIEKDLEGEPDLKTLITIKEKLKSIQKKRGKIHIGKTEQDETLKNLLNKVNDEIKSYQESNKEEYIKKIDENLLEIKKILDGYDYITSVTKIRTTPIWKETEDMIGLLDATTKSEYEEKMNTLEINKINELKDITDKQKQEESQQINKIKSDIKGKIEELKLIFSGMDDANADEIEDWWNSNELVLEINKILNPDKKSSDDNLTKVKIPQKDADDLLLLLRRTFDEIKYKSMINSIDSVGIVHTLDNFGIDTSLYYDEDGSEKVEWKLSGKQQPNGKISLTAVVTNGETHKYDKSLYLESFTQWEDVKINGHTPKFDMTEDEFYKFQDVFNEYLRKGKQEMQKLSEKIKNETDEEKKKELRKTFRDKREYYKDARYVEILMSRLIKQQKLNPRSKVPPRNPNYIVLDEEKEILKTLSARLRCQKKYGGIEILEGGPGLGKTVMCEFLANVTNREIAVVACGDIDPETMICSPGMKGQESVWILSDWVKLMQKPGTLIVFDEIDKLPPAAIAKLHSLFDTRKSVYEGGPGEIKANPDCLFMGTRNLYDTLSNPIASRARILRVTYPSAINEAYKISKYADKPILNVMKYEDFCALYDKYIIRQEPEPKNSKEKELYQEIINIDKLLQVFTKLRELFSEDSYNYEISYRDAQQVYIDYNNGVDFKTATMNALLWGAGAVTEGDKEEKQDQIDTVKNVIDSIM